MKKDFLFFILILFLLACTPLSKNKTNTLFILPASTYELSNAQLKVPGITMERLSAGKKFYISKCSGCHALKNPSGYTVDKWEPILQKMFVKAKLTDEEEKMLIRDYVMAISK